MTKIAFMIPTTSKNRNEWNDIKDTYLYKILFKSFIKTYCKDYEYHFYIGYDYNDRIFSNHLNTKEEINKLFDFSINVKMIEYRDIKPGYLTIMWNVLFKQAYNDGCDFFFQCGDDIKFMTNGWITDCINVLNKNNMIGIAGPINNNNKILTQVMFTRKHMDFFGHLFPEQIINWGCDDWYNYLYSPEYLYILKNHFAFNIGGKPRYDIDCNSDYIKNYQYNTLKIRIKAKILAYAYKQILLKKKLD